MVPQHAIHIDIAAVGMQSAVRKKRERGSGMFMVSVMYPNRQDAWFDIDYYRTKHMDLVAGYLRPFGLVRTEVLRGVSGPGGEPALYVCVGNLYFKSADGYEKGIAASGGHLRGDIPNFTNVTPVRQISEVIAD